MKKLIIFMIFFSLWGGAVFAQAIELEGRVKIEEDRPAEFASVVLYMPNDTIPLKGTYSDNSGYYKMVLPGPGKYLVEARFLGYEAARKELLADSSSELFTLNFVLDPSVTQIDEARVEAVRKDGFNRRSTVFEPEEIEKATSIHQLAQGVPHITLDARGKISSATGNEPPLLLLNGRVVSEQQLQAIPADRIISIDRIDIAPAFYNTKGIVLDFKTKPLKNGQNGNIELTAMPMATDGAMNLTYNIRRERHNLTFLLNGFWRFSRKADEWEEKLSYTTDETHEFQSLALDKMKYQEYEFKTIYSHTRPGRYLDLSVGGYFEKLDRNQKRNATNMIGGVTEETDGFNNLGSQVFTPVVDFLYYYYFDNASIFVGNLVYTYNTGGSNYEAREWNKKTEAELWQDRFNTTTSKHSIIGQLQYRFPLIKTQLQVGNQAMLSYADFGIDAKNSPDPDDKLNQFRNQSYITWFGSFEKFFFSVEPKLAIHYASEHNGLESSQISYFFNPRAEFGYYLPRDQKLRFLLETENNVPQLGMTTQLMRQMLPNYYIRMNPYLKNSQDFTSSLYYDWGNDYVSIASVLQHKYVLNSWASDFNIETYNGKKVLVESMFNMDFLEKSEFQFNLSLMPLGDYRLKFELYAHPFYQRFSRGKYHLVKHFGVKTGFNGFYMYKFIGVQASFNPPYKQLQNYFVDASFWYSTVAVVAMLGPIMARVFVENLFAPETSKFTSFSNLALQSDKTKTIRNNHLRLGISLAFRFDIGDSEYAKFHSLNNEDQDRGI